VPVCETIGKRSTIFFHLTVPLMPLTIRIAPFGALVQYSGVWAHSQSQLHTTVNYTSVQHLAEPDTPGGSETLSSI